MNHSSLPLIPPRPIPCSQCGSEFLLQPIYRELRGVLLPPDFEPACGLGKDCELYAFLEAHYPAFNEKGRGPFAHHDRCNAGDGSDLCLTADERWRYCRRCGQLIRRNTPAKAPGILRQPTPKSAPGVKALAPKPKPKGTLGYFDR